MANSQAEDDASKDHPYTSDSRARLREPSQMPGPRLEWLAVEKVTCDGDTICCIGTKDSEREDGAVIVMRRHDEFRLIQTPQRKWTYLIAAPSSSQNARHPRGTQRAINSQTAVPLLC